jgi:hypothetical protein
VLRQSGANRVEIVDSFISRVAAPLLLLDAEGEPPILDKRVRSVMGQFDTTDAHSVSMSERRGLSR